MAGKKKKKGILGTGLGPDVSIGAGTLFKELGGGVTGLLRLAAPGSKVGEPGWAEAGKGLLSSLAGTAATSVKYNPMLPGLDHLTGSHVENAIEALPAHLFGDDYRAKDIWTRAQERGLLPALVEDVGNASLAGGAVTAPIKAASRATGVVGATGTSAKLGSLHTRLIENPGIRAIQHPYRTTGSAVRESVLKPARTQAVENSLGAGPLTRGLAAAEGALESVDARRFARDQTRAADSDRMTAATSPAVQSAVKTARSLVIDAGKKQGQKIPRAQASQMIGDEIWARATGVKALESVVPAAKLQASGIRTSLIPDAVHSPELDAALDAATELFKAEKVKATDILASSRKGTEGLQPDDALPTLTKKQGAALKAASKMYQRAESPVLGRKVTRERSSRENFIKDLEAKLVRLDTHAAKIPEQTALAETAFGRSRFLGAGPPEPVNYRTTGPDHLAAAARAWPKTPWTPEAARTMPQVAAQAPKLPEPAGSKDFFKSGRDGQKAVAQLEHIARRAQQIEKTRAQVTKSIEDVRLVLDGHKLPSEIEQQGLVTRASRIMGKVAEAQETPSVARTPARWQPLMHAIQTLATEAETNPALASIVADLPKTLQDVQDLALRYGFDASHVRDFSPRQVRRLVFGNMRLGLGRESLLHEVSAGTRKSRTLALSKAGGVDRSIEALLAATVEATNEARTNAVVTWVEDTVARKIKAGDPVPAGWRLWDPVRTFMLTGTDVSEKTLKAIETAGADAMIVPDPVVRTLDRFTRDYDHWALRSIARVTSPWRTLMLTLSPGWYTRNFVGNVMIAAAEGVSLKDWSAAWKSYRTKDDLGRFSDIPFVRSGGLAREAGVMADNSVIPRAGIREAISESTPQTELPGAANTAIGAVRGGAQEISRHLLRVNEVVDEFARAAVFHKAKNRMNMPSEAAWKHASQALVDYNALSPFERSAVRAVLPFYAWQKGILKVTINQALDHPARTSLLMMLGQINDEYIADRFGVEEEFVPDAFRHLVGDKNIRGYNPFADPGELLSVEGITRSMNPFLELGIRKGLGAPEFFPEGYRVGSFGQPQADVDVPTELTSMVTRSPGGRIIGSDRSASSTFGLRDIDETKIRDRLKKTRKKIKNAENKEESTLLPPRAKKLL